MHEYLLTAVLSLGIAVTVNIFFKKLNLPLIIGYILSGVLIVHLFDLLESSNSHFIMEFAEFGIVFLMFMIGLEFSAQKIKSMKKEVGFYGSLQVVLSSVIFFLIANFVFGFSANTSLIIGMSFALSSTAIVLKSFNESKEIYTPYGKNALGVLIFQDIAVIPIMLAISLLSNSSESVQNMLYETAISALLVLFLLFVVGRKMIEALLKHAAASNMDEIFVGALLFILMGASMLADYFGFSYSLGAFIAGMIIAETKYKYKAEADLNHFRDLLLGIFFVTVGFHINLTILYGNFFEILGVLAGVMFLKALIIFVILIFFEKREIAFKSAISLSQVGEFSFALFYIATNEELLNPELYDFLLLVVVLSMMITPFLLKYMGYLSLLFKKNKELLLEPLDSGEMQDHVLVCGYGTVGREIVDFLKKFDVKYICIDHNVAQVEEGLRRGDHIFLGNLAQKVTLNKLKAELAVAAVIVTDDIHVSRVLCERLLDINPNLHIIVRTVDDEQSETLSDLKLYKIVNGKKEIGKKLAQAAVSCEFKRVH